MPKTKRILSFVLVLGLLLSLLAISPVFALDYKYGYFPDVADNHWAKQVITKMNLRGVAAGVPEGNIINFKPDQNVTQLEAILFATRTLGLKSDNAEVVSRYIPFDIPSWVSRASIVDAIDAGLIAGNNFDCEKKATRAWVAQLLVRMMNNENELSQVSEDKLPFSDSAIIPSEYLNYVKLAYKHGLIAGNTDNTFAPNNPVTRAQILAFLSRVEKHLSFKAPNLLIGTITGINGNNLSVKSGGQEYTLITNISSNVFNPTGEIWPADLRANDQVYIIVDGNIVKYLEVGNFVEGDNQPVVINPSDATGAIMQVFVDEKTIIIKNKQDKVETIALSAATLIIDDNNNVLSLNQLVKDMEIKVEYLGNKPNKIIVLTGKLLSGDEGIVFNINWDLKLLTLKNGDNLAGYLYNNDTLVLIGKNPLATIADLKKGDQVRIKAVDGLLESIQLVAAEVELSNTGIVQQLAVDSRLLTYELGDREYKTFYVDPKALIDFSGDQGILADIRIGDKISVNVENSKVTRITITNRKLYERMRGILVGNDSSNRIITFRDENNDLQAFEVSTGAEIKLNNQSVYLSYLEKDMQIELEINDNKITYLNAKDTLLATVTGINTGSRVIDLTLTTGERKTYNIVSNYNISMEGLTNYNLSDIDRGDIVEVKIESGRIKDIKVQRAVIFEITEILESSNRIRVKDIKNNSRYLYLYSDVEIDLYGKAQASIKDLNVKDIIKATYLGYGLQKIEMAPVIIGTISSIDSSGKTITVKAYDGQLHSLKFGNNSRIVKNGYGYTTMGTAAVGNRVAVRENIDGGHNFNLMTSLSGQVGFVYADKSKIFLKETQTTWKPYNMVPNTYLHNGKIELTPAEIKTDDRVELFMANDIVYEVLKK